MTDEPEAMRSVSGAGRTGDGAAGDARAQVLVQLRTFLEPGSRSGRDGADGQRERDAEAARDPASGVLWKLAESGRQLDANVVRMPAGHRVAAHAEPDLDVLLLVVGGDGTVHGTDGSRQLTEGTLLWLPRGALRALSAGPHGLSYLTVHRRRPGMQISRPSPEAS